MHILLISANTEAINMISPPIGLGAVAMATQAAGHEVKMLDLLLESDPETAVVREIDRLEPQLIGVSVRNIDDQSSMQTQFLLDQVKVIIRTCREHAKAPIVLGGAGYSIFPESALAYLGADMGIQGEGEAAFPLLAQRISGGQGLHGLGGLYLHGQGLQGPRSYVGDLDSLLFPEPTLWTPYLREDQPVWIPFQTRRGCPLNCSYCSTGMIEGHQIRKRSPRRAVDALARYVEAGFRHFFFVDNTFNLPSSYAMALCREIIDRGLDISWRCIVYPRHLDAALAQEMAAAGCRQVSLGFESGSEKILKSLNKRFTITDIQQISQILAGHGIERMGFLLLGGPGETKATVMESIAFVDALNLEALRLTPGIRIYPGTALAEQAVAEGMVIPEDDLLFPRFYLARDLDGWLQQTVQALAAEKPNWII